MPALGFKDRVDPSLVCFVTYMPWIPQIHLWYNTHLLTASMVVELFWSTYLQIMCPQALVGVQTHDHNGKPRSVRNQKFELITALYVIFLRVDITYHATRTLFEMQHP